MNVKPRHDFKPCVTGAFGGGLARTAYYDGMVLSEADMLREQAYWRTKRRLTNRALGDGIVWGLTLHWDARTRCFELCPGYGLSCCGDDLVVECPQTVCEGELIDPCSEDFRQLLVHASHGRDPCECKPQPDGPIEACLLLEYVECPEDPRSVFEDACARQPDGCRFGAVRETTRLRLVPPSDPLPPGPIETFQRQIDALRTELAGIPGAVVEPLFTLHPQRAQIGLAFLDAADQVLASSQAGLELADPAGPAASTTLTTPAAAPAALRIGLEPPPGHVFTAARSGGVDLPAAEVLMGVFKVLKPLPGAAIDIDVTLEVMPLLGSDPGRSVDVLLHVDPRPGIGPRLDATVKAVRPLPPRGDCASLLADGLLLRGDTGGTLRTLVLAVLCGWFKGGLLNTRCTKPKTATGEPPTAAEQGRLLLAWTICRLAWRALFGIDIRAAGGTGLETCLQRLFKAWCEGFHYKGPRCDAPAHGIVLGLVQVSTKGRILCFDEWAHRRHVLTGPLLMHWAGQLGLAPLDVSVARLARWICCVAASPMPALPAGMTLPETSVLSLGSGAIAAGKSLTATDKVGTTPVKQVRQVGALDFVGRVLDMLTDARRESFESAATLNAYTAPGGSVQLLAPASSTAQTVGGFPAPASASAPQALLAEVSPSASSLPVTVRLPMGDLVYRYAVAVLLSQLKARAGAPLFESMVAALEGSGTTTLADLVQRGPEPALAQLRSASPQHDVLADPRAAEKAIALVYDSAVKALAGVGDIVAERARAADALDPFTRADLDDGTMLTGLRKVNLAHLRRPAPELLKRIVAEAVNPPPDTR